MLIEEDYIDEFMSNLPKEKVKVIEENFEENKQLLHNALEELLDGKNQLIPYNVSIQNITNWLEEKRS